MGNRRQRVPVHGMNMSERPGNGAEVEAACYFYVFINVTRIIVVDKVLPKGLAKDNPRKH